VEDKIVIEKEDEGRRDRHTHTKIMKTALNLMHLKALESDGSLSCSKEPTAGPY
jgi:hypothetical protein